MKNTLKKISWIVLFVMITVTAIAFYCPMQTMGVKSTVAMSSISALCDHAASGATGDLAGCMNIHLSIVGKIFSNNQYISNIFLVLLGLLLVFKAFFAKYFGSQLYPLLARLRHRFLLYATTIKILIEKRLLSYLNLIGTYTIAFAV